MHPFFLLILAVATSVLVIPLAMHVAPALGMIDKPDPRKVHRAPVPRVGGWGIIAGCLLPLLILNAGDPLLPSWVAGCLVLFGFGSWDDARQIGHWPKFLGQILAAGLVVFWGGLYVTRLPFVDGDVLPPLSGQLFTMFAMIGVINAINHSDGLDGLAAGEVQLSLLAIALLGHQVGSGLITDVASAAIGGTLGFLRFNTHPARVFMGDAGSQFLGFTAAFLVIDLIQVANPATSAALPLLLLGLPLADILVVLYKRASSGMNWFRATRNHLHHRLLDLGFNHFQSVVAIYGLQLILVSCGVATRYAADSVVIATFLIIVIGLFVGLWCAERRGWRLSDTLRIGLRGVGEWFHGFRAEHPRRAALWAIAAAVSGLCLFASLWASQIPVDLGVLAALMVLGTSIASLIGLNARPMALRASCYVVAALAAWLFARYPGDGAASIDGLLTVLVLMLAAVVLAFLRFLSDDRFGTTPTDYLIAFALLVLVLFSRVVPVSLDTGTTIQFVTYAIVLFYGCEVLIRHFERWPIVVGGSTFATLVIIALRGLPLSI